MYRRLCIGLQDKGKLIPAEDSIYNHGATYRNQFKEYYTSIYKYSESQYQDFLKKGSVAGMTDLVTNLLVWDFDNKENPQLARNDASTLCDKLISLGVNESAIRVFFSGNKGMHVQINLTEDLTVEEFKSITKHVADGLETYDPVVCNPARIFRAAGSIHLGSGLYKIPFTLEELRMLSMEEIREQAKTLDLEVLKLSEKYWSTISLPKSLEILKPKAKEVKVKQDLDIDWSARPKHIPSCRYALKRGLFEAGERNNALMALGAFEKNQGSSEINNYFTLKGAAEEQSLRTGQEKFSKDDIWNTIIKVLYSPNWKGGQFSCKTEGTWLHDYCKSLGEHACKHEKESEVKPIRLSDLKEDFKTYVKTINENTILTGLPSLDKEVFLSTGANVMVIGAAGSGKTSIGIEILNNTSKAGVLSVCASLDMAKNRLFEKIMYRLTGYDRNNLYEIFKNDEESDLMNKLDEEFGNVFFFKKSAPTVASIKEYVLEVEKQTGRKVKLLVVDYLERVSSQFSEDTAASKDVAGDLQDLVDDLDICLITLVQPNKNALSGGPDQPIYDYTKIKGSSFVYQSARIIISAWRPFYNPKDFSNDSFMQMAILKNDLGELSELSFGWNGKRGTIKELEDEQRYNLQQLLSEKEAKKASKNSDSW